MRRQSRPDRLLLLGYQVFDLYGLKVRLLLSSGLDTMTNRRQI